MSHSLFGRARGARSRRPVLPAFAIERLESRQLLSAAAVSPAVAAKLIPTRAHPVAIKETEGQPFTNATVATLNADPADSFSGTIDWGDKTTPISALVIPDGSGGFTVEGSHDYVKFGFYVVKVKLTDANNKAITVLSSAKVADAPLSATGFNFTAERNGPFSGAVATFADADPNAVLSPKPTETATINWGDGTVSVGTLSQGASGGPFTVSGKHNYLVAKTYTVTTTIHDVGGSKATATGAATVLPPQPVTTPSLVGDYVGSVHVNIVGISTSLSLELNVSGQDLNSITGTLTVEGIQAVSGTFNGSGTVGELDNGNFKYVYTSGSINVTVSGHVSSDGKHITSGFVQASGLPITIPVLNLSSIHGSFSIDQQ